SGIAAKEAAHAARRQGFLYRQAETPGREDRAGIRKARRFRKDCRQARLGHREQDDGRREKRKVREQGAEKSGQEGDEEGGKERRQEAREPRQTLVRTPRAAQRARRPAPSARNCSAEFLGGNHVRSRIAVVGVRGPRRRLLPGLADPAASGG